MRPHVLVLALLAAVWAAPGRADQQIADIRQGTNLALTLAPDGQTLVVELVGQLWRLPASPSRRPARMRAIPGIRRTASRSSINASTPANGTYGSSISGAASPDS